MNKQEFLLHRLNEIGKSLSKRTGTLALIGLGSVGTELDRLDAYSDLDFFAIVENEYKDQFIQSLDWLTDICPVAYKFKNTVDGYKFLYQDGIFCEFAVFGYDELPNIDYSPGRIIWKRPSVPDSITFPAKQKPGQVPHQQEWLLGEALTNVYVGMCREKRGEHLTAMRFIQSYAVDRVIDLLMQTHPGQKIHADIFVPERRIEQRYPEMIPLFDSFCQGYRKNAPSASAIIQYLDANYSINQAMKTVIIELIKSV